VPVQYNYVMGNNMQIENLIKKFHLGTLTKEEMSFLLNYLASKEPQHELLAYYKNTWDKAYEESSDIDSMELYNRITKSAGISDGTVYPVSRSEKHRLAVRLRPVLQYAAVFIIAFSLSWLAQSLSRDKTAVPLTPVAEQIQIIEVPYGSKSRIVLPDSSVVILNSGSSIKYANSDFNLNRRSVQLTGEGFFNIKKNPSKPFYVTTPGMKVKVLGTTFNVKAYTDEDIEETTLVSGKVEIYSSSDEAEKEKPLVLKPNQRAVFIKSKKDLIQKDTLMTSQKIIPVKLQKINLQSSSMTEQTISWKENTLVFDNESFNSLVVKIERWYNVKIQVDYPELVSARFTGKFDKETLEQVLSALVTVTPFRYDINQNHITISKN